MKSKKSYPVKLTLFVDGVNAGSETIDFGKVNKSDLPARVVQKYNPIFAYKANIEFDQASGAVFIDHVQPEE